MTPYYSEGGIEIYLGDCREVLPSMPEVDLVVTDPPFTFGIGSSHHESGKIGGWGDLMNSSIFYSEWLRECKRLTVNAQGAAWVFTSWRCFPVLARAAHDIWSLTSLLVWDKCCIGPGGPKGLRPSYEMVGLLTHHDFSLPNRGLRDIWKYKWSSTKPNGHPAEKPVDLVKRLVSESGPARRILDPFMGSGTTLRAAKDLGRQAIGIEIEERWCEIAAKRLRQKVLDFAPVGKEQTP